MLFPNFVAFRKDFPSAAEHGDSGMSVRGMAKIPLSLIPQTKRSWQTSGCHGLIVLRSPLVAVPPRYGSAFSFQPLLF
jgi:hypothetical protein